MGLGRFFGKQFIDVIDWTDEPGVLAWRWPAADREIQHGAQLTVREGQAAMFLNEGTVADRFEPGLHRLETGTLPMLTSLRNWDKGFQSPFKSDIYFFSVRQQIDRTWGTQQPITLRDADFGTIRLRAFGRFAYSIVDVPLFWDTLVGSLDRFATDDLEPQLRAAIVTALATRLGGGQVPFLDLAANQAALSAALIADLAPVFARYGLELASLQVESLSLPEAVQAAIDKRGAMAALGDVDRYTRFQAAEGIAAAAANPGGIAGIGAGAAAGMAVGQAMAAGLGPAPQMPAAPVAPAPAAPVTAAPVTADDVIATIGKLHALVAAGALTEAEFDAKKAELLAKLG